MPFYKTYKFPKVAATTTQTISETADYRHFMFSVHASDTTTGSVRMKISFEQEIPDFTAPSTADNSWEYVAIRELGTGTLIAGATGSTVSASTINKNYEAETNGAYHIAFETTITSGDGLAINAFLRND